MKLTLDTDTKVFFYEQDHYYLSNFSAFRVVFLQTDYDTAEHAYHAQKFCFCPDLQDAIARASSAHQAFKLAERGRERRREDWDQVKDSAMLAIIRAKCTQHEYVRRKLLETGDRELVENSWRDDYWGWGRIATGRTCSGNCG
jgi:ribA/ribD-fused uncharacterized protein